MLTLYCVPKTRGFRVMWMLEELEQPYQLVNRYLHHEQEDSPDFLVINQLGKVPVLYDGEMYITQSPAINTYLGDKFSARQLVPEPGTPQRGNYEQWCYFISSDLEEGLWTMTKHTSALPPEQRWPKGVDIGWWEFIRTATLVKNGLGDKPFLLGEAFSAADILCAHTLMWARRKSIPIGDSLTAYMERCQAREAYQRAVEKESNM